MLITFCLNCDGFEFGWGRVSLLSLGFVLLVICFACGFGGFVGCDDCCYTLIVL